MHGVQRRYRRPSDCGTRSLLHDSAVKTVLVVEDTDDLRELFVQVLAAEGYNALSAENGQEALKQLGSLGDAPCLVLLDIMMPVMDGYEFLAALRENHQLAALPIVVLSATVTETVSGAKRVIKKPVSPETLISLVREFCGAP